MAEILIIDEDYKLVSLKRVLHKIHKLPCDLENDPVAAIDILETKEKSYKVILLDIMMPYIDSYNKFYDERLNLPIKNGKYTGIHILHHIRTKIGPASNDIKILIHSAMSEDFLKPYIKGGQNAVPWAAEQYLQKSKYSNNQIADIIKKYLK